jgi:alkylation response protein AidB-like acyl-CoA dehydrogenase
MSLSAYLAESVAPHADRWDREERIPRAVLADLAGFGLLGASVPDERARQGLTVVKWGEALEAVGEASMSLLSVLTVHAMCTYAVARWLEPEAQQEWLADLLAGAKLGGFALTEPGVGSDAKAVTTQFADAGDHWRLTGAKRWISSSEIVDVLLVVGQAPKGLTAVLVPRETPGLTITPISGVLGFRAARQCELNFNEVVVPKRWTLGGEGMGFSQVGNSALDVGRFCVACGSTGLIRACVRASVDYAHNRRQFGVRLSHHQLIQAMIADMATAYQAANALWRQAAQSREELQPSSIMETTTAKYFAAKACARAANDTVQIHGANGCGPDYPVQRYFRDARVTELIEGSNQMQQIMIALDALSTFASRRKR